MTKYQGILVSGELAVRNCADKRSSYILVNAYTNIILCTEAIHLPIGKSRQLSICQQEFDFGEHVGNPVTLLVCYVCVQCTCSGCF